MIKKIIRKQITQYLQDTAFISMDQSAYMFMKTFQENSVNDDWLNQINDYLLTCDCLLHISKRFDFAILQTKNLDIYGITGNELQWFSNYLKIVS